MKRELARVEGAEKEEERKKERPFAKMFSLSSRKVRIRKDRRLRRFTQIAVDRLKRLNREESLFFIHKSSPSFVMERDPQTHAVIGSTMEVHRVLGPGYLEAVYQEALEIEFDLRGIPYKSQPEIRLEYKGRVLRKTYRPDFLVFDRIVLEIKAQSALGSR